MRKVTYLPLARSLTAVGLWLGPSKSGPDEPSHGGQQHESDQKIRRVKRDLERLIRAPFGAQNSSEFGKRETPDQRPEEGVDLKTPDWHSSETGWQRNEGSNERQEPSDEDRAN